MTDVYERYVARIAEVKADGTLCMNMWHMDDEGDAIVEGSHVEPTLLTSIVPGEGVTIRGKVKTGDVVIVLAWEDADGSQVIIEAE